MGRVGLGHHRAAGGERGGRVAARHREGEGEVRGAEHRDRADGDLAQAQVGARQGLALGLRRVDPGLQETAVAHHAGEHLELADGAAALAFEPGAGQAALGHAAHDQLVAEGEDRLGHRFQEAGAVLQRGLAVGVEGLGREGAGPVHVGRRRRREGRLQAVAGGGLDRPEGLALAAAGGAADQVLSGDPHGVRVLSCDARPPGRSARAVGIVSLVGLMPRGAGRIHRGGA